MTLNNMHMIVHSYIRDRKYLIKMQFRKICLQLDSKFSVVLATRVS